MFFCCFSLLFLILCFSLDGWESQWLKYERKQDEDMVEEDLVWYVFNSSLSFYINFFFFFLI